MAWRSIRCRKDRTGQTYAFFAGNANLITHTFYCGATWKMTILSFFLLRHSSTNQPTQTNHATNQPINQPTDQPAKTNRTNQQQNKQNDNIRNCKNNNRKTNCTVQQYGPAECAKRLNKRILTTYLHRRLFRIGGRLERSDRFSVVCFFAVCSTRIR